MWNHLYPRLIEGDNEATGKTDDIEVALMARSGSLALPCSICLAAPTCPIINISFQSDNSRLRRFH